MSAYKPRTYRTKRAPRKKTKTLPPYVWLLLGLAIGLFIALVVYLAKPPAQEKQFSQSVQHEIEKLKQQSPKKPIKPIKQSKQTHTEQKFKFYTLLPELEVFIPESETQSSSHRNRTEKQNATTRQRGFNPNKQYVLQVGSFQNLADAKKLKANLAFLGLNAQIQHVVVNKQQWHRVRTGPYSNKDQLYNNKKLLKQNNILAISLELK